MKASNRFFHGGHSGFGSYGGGLGGGFGGGFGGERPVEEVVNNYYGDSPERERHDFGGGGGDRYENDRYEGEHHEGGEHFRDASYETSGDYDKF